VKRILEDSRKREREKGVKRGEEVCFFCVGRLGLENSGL
jgi:hypothetical protein